MSKFGLPAVCVAALLYIILRGDLRFTYPRKGHRPNKN